MTWQKNFVMGAETTAILKGDGMLYILLNNWNNWKQRQKYFLMETTTHSEV